MIIGLCCVPLASWADPHHKIHLVLWVFVYLIKTLISVCFSDAGEATLRIIGAASEDDGVYTCVATNELGSVTTSASLRVLGKCAETSPCTEM